MIEGGPPPGRPLAEAVSRCLCSKHGKKFGLVFRRLTPRAWVLAHSYSVNESYEEPGCDTEVVKGSVELSDDYNCCKWCADGGLFQCGNCGAFNCQGSERGGMVRCAECGNSGPLSGFISSFSSSKD